jgi:hypothetical protein
MKFLINVLHAAFWAVYIKMGAVKFAFGGDTPSTLSGLFKEVYGDSVQNLVPDAAKFIKIVPFVPEEKEIGNYYHQPVILSHEQGVTYAAFNAGAFSLNDAIAMTMQDAQVSSCQILLRSAISYDAAARASKSKKAFQKATQLIVENMIESMSKRVEIANLYGQSGLATIASSVNVDANNTTLTITTGAWATGMWAGMENATLDAYRVTTIVGGTTPLIIKKVNSTNRTLVVYSATTADITALDSAISSYPDAVTLYFAGAYGNEMAGLNKIITNTGTLFNINATTYALWQGNTYPAGSAALTMGKVLSAVALAVDRGLNEDVTCFLNTNTWANVMSDLAALRRYDGSYEKSKAENGVQKITFYSQNGKIDIVSHNIIKESESFIFPQDRCKRIGAQDMSFKTPGREEEIFLQLASNAGFEIRNYTDQALFLETPARAVKITNIVNS